MDKEIRLRSEEFRRAKDAFCHYLRGLSDQDEKMMLEGVTAYSPRTLSEAVRNNDKSVICLVGEYYELIQEIAVESLRRIPSSEYRLKFYCGYPFTPDTMLREIKHGTVLGRKYVLDFGEVINK